MVLLLVLCNSHASEASAYLGGCIQDTDAGWYPVDGHRRYVEGSGRGGLSAFGVARASEEGGGADGGPPSAP